MFRVITSTSAAARLGAATRFLQHRPPSAEVIIVGASRGAADDLVRSATRRLGATFGLWRFSLTELAARSAAPHLAETTRAPVSQVAGEAIATRAVFDAVAASELTYFKPVAAMPGFPKALARTIDELRLSGVAADRLTSLGPAGADLAVLLTRVEEQLDRAAVDDRAALFRAAADAWAGAHVRWAGLPLVLLDVTVESRAEEAFVAAIAGGSSDVLATVPDGDHRAWAALQRIGSGLQARTDVGADIITDDAPLESDLWHLRRYVFTNERPPVREQCGDVRLFSAPGEGRETVEIVRRVLDEAGRGVRFDEMAVFLRSPQQYVGLLEHACARGGVPGYFDRGTRRPDPAGRAFVALLSCGVEGLSAKRFDEYLSLGQVPRQSNGAHSASSTPHLPVSPGDELFGGLRGEEATDDPASATEPAPLVDSDEEAIVAGTLRSPWKWEELIVESAVVGGRTRHDGSARWRRRLSGLAADYEYRIAALKRDEPESARIPRYERDLQNLAHLRAFALPIVEALGEWPEAALWGEWLERFSVLAERALSRPARVLKTLADLRPMSEVGPVTLEEARDVLHDRLVTLDWDPPARRYGRLFVGTPHQARGRSFRVVFVPGLAERVVPQRPREDPLLLDARRRETDSRLVCQDDRGAAERLLLKVAIGAAVERLYLSYPRMDVGETRARVPSFYALDVMRAVTGRVPDHRVLAADAADEAGASLAWPAPHDPDRAIDDLEHDLAVLKPLLDSRSPLSVKGHAHYLLGLNDALRRSVISRWARGRGQWSPSDGLIRIGAGVAPAIAANRLGARAFSLSALQRFSVCPYQFLLATIHRLEPWDEPEPLVRMDPLTRGSLFHSVQAGFYRTLQSQQALPVTRHRLPLAISTLHLVLDRVADEYAERLAPAIDRVWRDEIAEIRRDLEIWVQKLVDETTWVPEYFEFSFGLSDEGRDPRSVRDPVTIDGRFILRGSVDLIERHVDSGALRVTDHKTGRNRSTPELVVGKGAVLQPVLYSVAVSQALNTPVVQGRLFYCTTAGGYLAHPIEIDEANRRQGIQVLEIIDRAVEQGFLVAAPDDRACGWCDFRPVCGPREEERIKRKAQDRLADLHALRGMR
ncbi:MAG: PD-(D/E)XK nuclease family protein [Luteitalea sp.]|nr:PD-(D/E)XK nuclease family protein [Luteitalea sp.]